MNLNGVDTVGGGSAGAETGIRGGDVEADEAGGEGSDGGVDHAVDESGEGDDLALGEGVDREGDVAGAGEFAGELEEWVKRRGCTSQVVVLSL